MNGFVSTRGYDKQADAPRAVLEGLAADGGLYILKDIPAVPVQEMAQDDFYAVARKVLAAYLPGYSKEEIDICVQRAYDGKFDDSSIAPLKAVGEDYVLELFHGPTAAFKDVALSVLPQLMRTAMDKTGWREDMLILTATSGDTGSAALTGFCDVPGIRVLVFYPQHGISPIQRAQMTAMRGENVGVCAVEGNFDAAQSGVKRIFAEMPAAFLQENGVTLSSANSINFGRLAPQIVYYYTAYLDLVRAGRITMGDKVDFCVPTGNFGDILAGYFAKLSGLPVGRLICASNANKVLTDFFETGVYDRNRDFLTTISPSMDILISSNLERLLYLALENDAEKVKALMEQLKATGRYEMPKDAMEKIRAVFAAGCASDEEAMQAIRQVFADTGYVMDPHTAVAWKVAQEQKSDAPMVVLSTASPYKFPESVLTALGKDVPRDAQAQICALEEVSNTHAPQVLRDALTRPVRFKDVIDPADMMAYVQRKAAKA